MFAQLHQVLCKLHSAMYIVSLCHVCSLRLIKILFCSVLLRNLIFFGFFRGGGGGDMDHIVYPPYEPRMIYLRTHVHRLVRNMVCQIFV